MENVKETIEGTLEDVNEAIVEIANDFNDFAGEFSFSDLLDVGKTVGETLEIVGTKLNGMKEAEMEEMVYRGEDVRGGGPQRGSGGCALCPSIDMAE